MTTISASRRDGTDAYLNWGGHALRWALVLIFLWFGFMKFTAYEAKGIAPLVMNSPVLAWAYNLLGERGFATALGIVELTIGVLIALRPWSARVSGIGSVASIITFVVTLSFILTTPGVWQEGLGFPYLSGPIGQFLIKDVVLLAASIWTAGEAFAAARVGR
ncbi:MAG: YkgB family protein [Pseudomonadota bacterium]|nr:YkgB family protein [Pseudomonadota bacterium]